MFGLIKKMFIGLLISIVNASNHTKCVSLSNQKCMTQPTLINVYPNEYSQEFYYFLLRCVGSCNFLNDLSNKVCAPNKTEDLNISIFNMITGINESKLLSRYHAVVNVDLMEGNVTQINGETTVNVDVSVRNVMNVKKIIFGVVLHVVVKMENI